MKSSLFSSIIWISCFLVLSYEGHAQVKPISLNQLEKMISQKGDSTIVVNFWATWCAPCIKELPYFEEAADKYRKDKVTVLLVSLDDPEDLSTRVIPFVNNRKVGLPVYLLNESDPNDWIPKVSKEWTGSIPATWIIHGKKRDFYEMSFEANELDELIHKKIQ